MTDLRKGERVPTDLPMVSCACPGCGSQEARPLREGLRDVENGVEGTYAVRECRSCGFIFLCPRPRPEFLHLCYDERYHVRTGRGERGVFHALFDIRYHSNLQRLLRHLGRKPLAILEIGIGDGQFLFYMEKRLGTGCRLVGTDLDINHVHPPPNSRVELVEGSIDDMTIEGPFDLIVMNDVLEHLQRPAESLRRIGLLLAPGGRVVTKVPNWNSLWRIVFPRHWSGLQIPRHQCFFTPRMLRLVFEQAGFAVQRMVTVFDPGDLSVTICNWLTDRLRLKTPPRHAWFYVPMALLAAPIVAVQLLLLRQSGEIECVAAHPVIPRETRPG